MIRRPAAIAALVATTVFLVAACGASSTGSTTGSNDRPAPAAPIARPGSIADIAAVQLVGPEVTNAGRAPVFEWQPVADAAAYRLSVLGPERPTWSWQGAATSIRYGGVDEGVNGPSIVAGSHWSVAALGADGSVLALSDLRPVSPTNDTGPAPGWTKAPQSAAPTENPAETAEPIQITACDLVTPDEIEEKLGRPVKTGEPDDGDPTGHCRFRLESGSPALSTDINPKGSYIAEKWAGEGYEPIAGLGEDSFAVKAGVVMVAGFVRGERSVTFTLSFGKKELLPKLVELAKLADQRLVALD